MSGRHTQGGTPDSSSGCFTEPMAMRLAKATSSTRLHSASVVLLAALVGLCLNQVGAMLGDKHAACPHPDLLHPAQRWYFGTTDCAFHKTVKDANEHGRCVCLQSETEESMRCHAKSVFRSSLCNEPAAV